MAQKGRPQKKKIIHQQPRIDLFRPQGRPGQPDEITISLEEYEAVRLHDHLRMSQGEAAGMMAISQQSFSRIVRAAHEKISDAIVNAKILNIKGGNFVNKRSLEIAKKLSRKIADNV